MDVRKTFRDLVRWAAENDDNRRDLITQAAMLVTVLNETRGKKLSDEQLDKIAAGTLTNTQNMRKLWNV